jgi:RES domain-containing protein
MRLYRIARTCHAGDLSGEGARRAGGRWNRKGTAVLYTADSVALATLEMLVHLPLNLLPHDYALAVFELPDRLAVETVDGESLPANWKKYPAPPELGELGTRWAQGAATVAFRVPSAVIPDGEGWNVLLNPLHPDFGHVRCAEITPYRFNERLFRRG